MLVNIGDVVDGALVNATATLGGRQVSVAVDGWRGRRPSSGTSFSTPPAAPT
jgi:hypothetical protein